MAAGALGCFAALGLVLARLASGPVPRERPPAAPDAPVALLLADADPAAGARLFRQCAACHTIGRGAPDLSGPNLYGVLGAPVAGNRPQYGYTRALLSVGGQWDAERMDAWLRNPQGFAPGTRMIFPGIPQPWDRADLIAYLNSQGPKRPLPGGRGGG